MEYQSVAIVDVADDESIVWQVDVSSDTQGSSRMCGAWVVAADEDHKVRLLTQSRYLLSTDAGAQVCKRAGVDGHLGLVDVAATLSAVDAEGTRLQEVFERAAAASKSSLIAPTWPRLPKPLDLANPPLDRIAPSNCAAALGVARWLESVAVAWESLERQRLIRRYMRGNAPVQRTFPLQLIVQPDPSHRPPASYSESIAPHRLRRVSNAGPTRTGRRPITRVAVSAPRTPEPGPRPESRRRKTRVCRSHVPCPPSQTGFRPPRLLGHRTASS
jgi:hypothetical protein